MNKSLSSSFIELTQDALLKAIWYKSTLRLFLQQHGISDRELAQWHADQSKREYLSWLWSQLIRADKGHGVILEMARSLAEMQHFPDLERKEDSKVAILEANEAVGRLRVQVHQINQTIKDTKEAERRRRMARAEAEQRLATQQSSDKLKQQLDELLPRLGDQKAGYTFEKWFYDLAIFFDIEARPSYRAPDGRQIDGAMTVEGTTFLIETKFTREPVESTGIDTFMAKIESKADNTMGLLVSIAGFDDGAKRAASKQRTPMLLLDHSHLFSLILPGIMTLPQVLSRIKRNASQVGSAYLGAKDF